MRPLRPPRLRFRGDVVDAAAVTARAVAFAEAVDTTLGPDERPALLIAPNPDAVALLFALLSLERPFVSLSPDPGAWPEGLTEARVRVVVPHGARPLAAAARGVGLGLLELPDAGAQGALGPLRCPSAVSFTSGSTGTPRAVCRPAAGLLDSAEAIAVACGLRPGDGILATLTLGGFHGAVNGVLLASLLDAEVTLVERFDHRRVLAEFATGRHVFWPCSPHMADVLSRCPLPGPAPKAPRVCKISGSRLGPETAHRFARRFGVPLLNAYGTTEHGVLTHQRVADAAAGEPTSVGYPVAGVRVAVGPRPGDPLPAGQHGRIWAHSPWQSDGLGFPPQLTPHPEREGDWIATADVGWQDPQGRLHLLGRSDDLFKTSSGHLVSPGAIEGAVASHPDVRAVSVVPLPRGSGCLVGAVVEASGVDPDQLRRHAADRLPEWARLQVVEIVDRMPRLPNTKVDRRACVALLDRRDRDGRQT